MIVSKSFVKYKKLMDNTELRPNTFVKIKGKSEGIVCILPSDQYSDGKPIRIDDEDVFGKFIELEPKNELQLLPNLRSLDNKNIRDIIYVTGKSGSGKSYFAGKYAKEYKKLFPRRKIIYISPQRLEDDDPLLHVNPFIASCSGESAIENWVNPETKFTIPEDDSFADGKPTESEFDNSLIIIDDLEGITNRAVKRGIDQFISSILHTGRHRSISVLFLNHIAANNKDTKAILNETHYITIFANSTRGDKIDYLLKTYCGLDREQIKYIKSLKSRWITISINHPLFVMTDKEIKIF